MTAHNTKQWDGPVCMWCGCGDQFVIQPEAQHINLWREVGVVAVIAAVIMAGILLTIQWMQRMLFL